MSTCPIHRGPMQPAAPFVWPWSAPVPALKCASCAYHGAADQASVTQPSSTADGMAAREVQP